MTTVLLLVIAAVLAVGDWVAVHRRLPRLEGLLKPATLALLVSAAATADLGDAKPWVVVALVLGLLGDVALLAPAGPPGAPPRPAFLAGLGAFLLGHLAWIAAFLTRDVHGLAFAVGAVIAVGIGGVVLGPVLAAARRDAGLPFAAIIAAYAVVLALAAAFAAGTGVLATAIGGVLFLLSDATLARERFVRPIPHGRVIVIVSYHLAQGLMVIGLVRSF
ncbi:lysoplasmalogenase family protein [uncultured Jatrophihabitans sp.]|uniref:lysoplasmalogenase family protein n=1 Tax=uncultured Jatrophihabitans sp. TaxID=1610747 RepID=UPI0035CBECCC